MTVDRYCGTVTDTFTISSEVRRSRTIWNGEFETRSDSVGFDVLVPAGMGRSRHGHNAVADVPVLHRRRAQRWYRRPERLEPQDVLLG